jgi:hypothetical protein
MTVTADTETDLDRTRFFIDGEWVAPLGSETHRALEAATGEPATRAPRWSPIRTSTRSPLPARRPPGGSSAQSAAG